MFTGEKIQILRKTRNKTQKEMAYRLGLSQQRYSAIEKSHLVNDQHTQKILLELQFSKDDALRILENLAYSK